MPALRTSWSSVIEEEAEDSSAKPIAALAAAAALVRCSGLKHSVL
jgi:hypothetical protein